MREDLIHESELDDIGEKLADEFCNFEERSNTFETDIQGELILRTGVFKWKDGTYHRSPEYKTEGKQKICKESARRCFIKLVDQGVRLTAFDVSVQKEELAIELTMDGGKMSKIPDSFEGFKVVIINHN